MLSLTMLLLLAAHGAGPTEPQKVPRPEPTPTAAAAYRADVEALCAESMAGRAAGTAGGELAERYVAERLRALGLPPLGDDHVQEFTVADPLPPAIGAATHCSVRTAEQTLTLRAGEDFCAFPFSPDGEFAGELVFAGHGAVDSALGIDDYRGLDVRDKVVLVLRGAPAWCDGRRAGAVAAHAFTFAQKVQNASARGARAVLLIERTDVARPLSPVTICSASGEAAIPFVWVARDAVARWLPGEWLDGVQRQLDARESAAAVPAAATIAGRVELRRRPPLLTANVLAIAAAAGGASDRRGCIVVGAHHDHIGRGEFGSLGSDFEIGRVHPGADDNASGVAAVLELARRFARRPAKGRAVVFACFGAEELGQLGSRWFLDHLDAAMPVMAMVDLNMIGRAGSAGLTAYGAGTGVSLAAAVERAFADAGALRLELRARSSYRSDQAAFLQHRVPALLFTSGLHDQYHRPADVPALVEVDGALLVVDAVERLLRDLAAADTIEWSEGTARGGGK